MFFQRVFYRTLSQVKNLLGDFKASKRDYDTAQKKVQEYRDIWTAAKPYVDAERWEAVNAKLAIQEHDARWWRDACVQYFGEFSGLPVPENLEQPQRPLPELKKIKLNMKHHN